MTSGTRGGQTPNPYTNTGQQAAAMLGNSIPGGTSAMIGNALLGSGAGPGTAGSAPPWMQGLQLGQQIAQMGGQPQRPGQPPTAQRPMGGTPGGMPQGGVVPGAGGMTPPVPSQPNPMGGAPNTGQQPAGQISPQILQQLMMMKQRGLMG